MVEQGLIKMGGAKLLNTALLPNFAILIMGGIIAWQFFKSRKERTRMAAREEKETLATLKTGIDVLMTEQREISAQMAQLQEKLLAFQNTESGTAISLQTGIDMLKTEQRDILVQIIRLQEKHSALQKANPESEISTRNTPRNAFMNKASNPTKEPAKLAMFQRLIDDNVKLRQ
ncbi:MAG: hypothetical protein VSS75_034330 [Candidatus Parabeggiatoa sp.]|nr:hypothetical protein [Candidatus Parabeggiatoa sp.]